MKVYGLIGQSLKHSFSKDFFSKKFDKEGHDAEYRNFELSTIEQVKELRKENLSGLNVTIPYKKAIIPFLDELSVEAKAIGAVNTIEMVDGKWIGHNTDAHGFQQSIKPFLTFHHEKALILGTGGASLAVKYVLKKIGLDVFSISRTERNEFTFAYEDINEHMLRACKLVVNTTPLGTWPETEEFPVLPYENFTVDHLAVDLIYNPPKTQFLAKAEAYGATSLNGQSMLEQQALKAWELWNK